MPGAAQYTQDGPSTYEVSVAVTGGMVVEWDGTTASAKIRPCSAGSLVALGVALSDANPAGTDSTPMGLGGWARPEVAVAHGLNEVYVTYAAITTLGQALICAASGQVTPAGATPDARTVIGRCTEPAGVAAGAVGRMRIYV
jgi:hypothetical protein